MKCLKNENTLKSEIKKRRQLRLLQVRDQEKQISKTRINDLREMKNMIINKKIDLLYVFYLCYYTQKEWNDNQTSKLLQCQEKLANAFLSIGNAHNNANSYVQMCRNMAIDEV